MYGGALPYSCADGTVETAATEPRGIAEQRKRLPDQPGVYLFNDGDGRVVYVGKARSIRKRVACHFSGPRRRCGEMADEIASIDFLVTETEAEALLAEQQFIKRHRPLFNIRLRDDKSYPYIGISLDEEFPRVYFTRERHRPDRVYFGPYSTRQARARDARPARQAVPVPDLRGAGAGPALRRALPRLLHQALRGALRRLHRPRGVPAQHRRDRRLPLRPLPRRRARPGARRWTRRPAAQEFERAARLPRPARRRSAR